MAYDLTLRIAAVLLEVGQTAVQASWNLWNASFDRSLEQREPVSELTLGHSEINLFRDASAPENTVDLAANHVTPNRASHVRHLMYNLLKAKEEIDTVAKHTTDLAVHVLALGDNVEQKLESFKKDILSAIDARFSDLERTLVGGEQQNIETSAISDLGAKVSQLLHGANPPSAHHFDEHSDNNHSHSGDYGHQDFHGGNHDHHG